jgi:hypothetical protein
MGTTGSSIVALGRFSFFQEALVEKKLLFFSSRMGCILKEKRKKGKRG